MKKNLLSGLIIVLMLVTAAVSFAASPLTVREIIEQVAVPMALANDPEYGTNRMYSAEELATLIHALNDNGIELPENNMIMQMVTNGHGLYEESAIYGICEQELQTDGYYMSLEDEDWLGEQLTRIGSYESHTSCVPGPDNMTCAEAEAFALDTLNKAYGDDLPFGDRSIWRLGWVFYPAGKEYPEDRWFVHLEPRDIDHGSYSVAFNDKDPAGTVEINADVPDWTEAYTAGDLTRRFVGVYGAQEMWSQSIWQRLHEMSRQAEITEEDFPYQEYRGYQLTDYPEPDEADISREEAIRIAKDAVNKEHAALNSAVLTEYEGERSWLVHLVIWAPWDIHGEDPESGNWIVSIDSKTGSVRKAGEGSWVEAYVPEGAVALAEAEMPREPDYLQIAVDAVKQAYPELDPLDEAEYAVSVQGIYTHYVNFTTKNIRHGSICVELSEEGEVREVSADRSSLTCDNLFERYWMVHGYFGQWDQSVWVQLEQDKAGLKARGIDGKALKQTRYPEESSVSIGHEKAQQLGIKATGKRRAEVNTCVLVDAKPHPVWIMRILTDEETDPVIGIDAETGETVFTEKYVVDETPHYVLYSMPKTWKKLEK